MWIDRRILFAVVTASLLLNVFLGGAVLGRMFGETRRADTPPRATHGQLVPPAHVHALPPADRQRFKAAMAMHRPAIRAAREAHRAARLQLETDIAAPTFDRARISADFQALQRSNHTTDAAVDDALVDALAELPPESRALLVSHAIAPPPAPTRPPPAQTPPKSQ